MTYIREKIKGNLTVLPKPNTQIHKERERESRESTAGSIKEE